MKKIFTALFFICLAIVLAYGGLSYWVGGQALKLNDQLAAQINNSNWTEVSTQSSHRGLFSSTALSSVTLTRPGGGDSIKFNIINTIHHGPFVFLKSPHLKGSLQPVLAIIHSQLAPGDCSGDLKKLLEKIPELQASEALTVISFDGNVESYCDVPAFQRKFTSNKSEEFQVQWGGSSAKSKFDSRLKEISGSYTAPSLQIMEKNDLLRAKNIKGDFNSHPGVKGISVGSMALSIETLDVLENDEPSCNLLSFGMRADSGVSGETVNCSIGLSFDKLDAGGLGVGPFAFEFEARKLDAEVLSRFEHALPELRDKAAGRTGDVNGKMDSFLKDILFDLLVKSPEFEIKQLKIRTDKGDLSGRAKLAFSGPGGNLGNVLTLLAGIDASAELSVSEALFFFAAENALRDGSAPDPGQAAADSAGEMVKGLLGEKIMIRENGAFSSSAAFKHGRLVVNGHKMDFSRLLGNPSGE